MTWHDSNHTGAAVFINKENFVFALPLLCLCTIYAYFQLVPLNIALSIIGAVIVLYKTTTGIKAQAVNKKEEKIASLDDSFLQELAADDLRKEEHQKKSAAKKKSKAESKARQRIAAQNKKHKTVVQDEDEDDGDLSTFVRKNK